MSGKEDLRVKRTKKALFESFFKLLNEKPFDEITVNELCDVAGVRRATFYKHYSDKFDFVTACTHVLRDNFDRGMIMAGKPELTQDYYVAYAKRVLHYIDENAKAIDNICKSHMFPSVLALIFQQNIKDTSERLRISVASGMKLTASIEVVSSACTGAVAACVYRWLSEGRKVEPDVMAEQIGAIVEKIIK